MFQNKTKSLEPLIKWSGGKRDEIEKIKKYIPNEFFNNSNQNGIYLEPFVGGGALYFYLNPQNFSIINDVHKELIDFYSVLKKGHFEDIYEFMKNNPNDEETYYKVRSMKPRTELENAKRFYYLRKTCYRGMLRYNKKGEFNIPYGRYKTCNYELFGNSQKYKDYKNLFERTEITNQDFSELFNEKYNNKKNFMFLDPPYDSQFTDYGYCQFGKEEQKRLANLFKNTKIRCLMVIGKTPFIEELYKDYIIEEYPKNYRFKLHSGRINENTNHLIIKNY